MKLSVLTLLPLFLCAQVPQAFFTLGNTIEGERPIYLALMRHENFQIHNARLNAYLEEMDRAFVIGHQLDEAIEEAREQQQKRLHGDYLRALRQIESQRSDIHTFYFQELQKSMELSDESYFLFLIQEGKSLLQEDPVLRERSLSYAKERHLFSKSKAFAELKAEQELDERSWVFSQRMHEEYQAHQEVLKKEEALRLRQLLLAKHKGGVIVYAQERKGDIDFYIENLFNMHVSSTLFIENIQGYETDSRLPLRFVLAPKEKRKALHLKNSDVNGHVGDFRSHISWVKGSVNAVHDPEFIYALPFHDSHKVSQGFNGNTSHRGNARYAIDFAMDIGTPVYAARGGKVVEIVQEHDRHGMGLQMRQYANYVIIEHDDKTLGRYFHLKHKGVTVALDEEVKEGALIGYSGNTGRTSGAHLHFVVTKAESINDNYRSVSLPIRFRCSEGVVDKPITGQFYCSE